MPVHQQTAHIAPGLPSLPLPRRCSPQTSESFYDSLFPRFEECVFPPERRKIRTPSFPYAPIFQQIFQLAHELLYVLKVHVHRSEAHVCHFVELLQPVHDHFADFRRCQFTLGTVVNHRFDLVNHPFQLRCGHRALFACFQESLQYLLPLEALAPSVLLDDLIGNFIDPFVGREAPAAFQAFTPPADGVPAAAFSRIDHLVIYVRAKGTLHEAHLLTVLTGLFRPALLSHAPARATCPTTVLPESRTAHPRGCTLRSQSAREQSRRRSPAPFLPQISS